jgi:hypothetical protein
MIRPSTALLRRHPPLAEHVCTTLGGRARDQRSTTDNSAGGRHGLDPGAVYSRNRGISCHGLIMPERTAPQAVATPASTRERIEALLLACWITEQQTKPQNPTMQ